MIDIAGNKFKKLAIISDCIHTIDSNGKVASQNHIYIKQMQALSSFFDETLICCPFVEYSAEMVLSNYSNPSIKFYPLKNVGGNSLFDKIKILRNFSQWFKAYKKANEFADIVYQRFPNNLNIPGFFYFYFKKKKVFATYTGVWKNYNHEPKTFRFQKWLLKNFFRGPVWVYAEKNISKRIIKGFSPSYSLEIWDRESAEVEQKIKKIKSQSDFIPNFITVGTLVTHKNQQFILNVFKILNDKNFKFKLFVVGNGKLRNDYISFVNQNNLQDKIFITGGKTDIELQSLYRQCDFLIQAPRVEGFGKVPIEGFFHGVVPILNEVGLALEMTGKNERGFLFNIDNSQTLVDIIENLYNDKSLLCRMILNGRNYCKNHTLESWSADYIETVNNFY